MAVEGEIIENTLMTTKPFGRPVKWSDPAQFADLVDSYFNTLPHNDVPTLSELAVFLDSDRKTLLNYSKKDDFLRTIQRAKSRCEAAIEKRGLLGGLNPAISIFSLKNNYGWVDKTEVEQSGEVTHKYEQLDDKDIDARLNQVIESGQDTAA